MAERKRARLDLQKIFSLYNHIPDFPIGCEVILTIHNPDRFYEGTLKWIGSYEKNFWAVVQLNEVVEGTNATNGTFRINDQDVKLAECPPGTAHLAKLSRVSIPPTNLKIEDSCRLRGTEKRGIIKWIDKNMYGILLTNSDEGTKGYFKNKRRFVCGPNEGSRFCTRKDIEYLGPATQTESNAQRKLDLRDLNELCGRNRGIQGENISSYMDTLLFVFFAFSTNLQSKINARHNLSELQEQAKQVLLNKIVFPLRKTYFVSSAHVMEFRELFIQITGNQGYIGERRDFFECFDDFVQTVFGIESLVEVRYDGPHDVQMLHLQIHCQHPYETTYSWIDELFFESTQEYGYQLKEIPKFLVLNLMRFERPGKEGTFSCVIPCMELELEQRLCKQRGNSDLINTLPAGAAANMTEDQRVHYRTMMEPSQARSTRLLLSGIVCFERSHYDCFARCGRISEGFSELKLCRWVHFSSLADRDNVANIPEVREVPVYEWIEYARTKSLTDSPIEDLLMPNMSDVDRNLAIRLFDRAYALIFESH